METLDRYYERTIDTLNEEIQRLRADNSFLELELSNLAKENARLTRLTIKKPNRLARFLNAWKASK